MKKILIFFGFLFLALGKLYCQDTIFAYAWTPSSYQMFDINDRDTTNKYIHIDTTQTNNIWQLGTPSKTLFNSAYSAPLALVTDTINTYPNNNTSSFSFIVWTNCNWFALYFTHRINTDSLSDGGVIEYSIDGGISWTNIINSSYTLWNFYSNSDSIASNSNQPGYSGNTGWITSSFQGPVLNSIVEYRFTFTSDGINTNKDGWMIDDIIVNGLMMDINENGANSFIQVFPNPTSDFITVKLDKAEQFKSAKIMDVLGKIILTTNQASIDISNFESGIYFMEITTTEGKVVKRIIRN